MSDPWLDPDAIMDAVKDLRHALLIADYRRARKFLWALAELARPADAPELPDDLLDGSNRDP